MVGLQGARMCRYGRVRRHGCGGKKAVRELHMTLVLLFGAIAVFSCGWLAYEWWATHGDSVHVQVVDKRRVGEDDSVCQLGLRIGDLFGGDQDTVRATRVDRSVWEQTELNDFVTARYRSFSFAGRTVNKLSVGGGPRREILFNAIFWSVAAAAAWYFDWG